MKIAFRTFMARDDDGNAVDLSCYGPEMLANEIQRSTEELVLDIDLAHSELSIGRVSFSVRGRNGLDAMSEAVKCEKA